MIYFTRALQAAIFAQAKPVICICKKDDIM